MRPKLQYAGVVLIVLTLADWYLSQRLSDESLWIMTSALFAAMFIAIFAFSSPRDAQSSVSDAPNSGNKAINIITWTVIGFVGIGVFYFAVSYYLDSRSSSAWGSIAHPKQSSSYGATVQGGRSSESEDMWRVQGISLLSNAWEKYSNSMNNTCFMSLEELRPYLGESFIQLGYPLGAPFEYSVKTDGESCRLCIPLVSSLDAYCVDSEKGRGRKSVLDESLLPAS